MTREPVKNPDELADAALRERLRAACNNGRHRIVNEDEVVAFVKAELFRAKGYPENPCTGAEFVKAMQAVASPLSEESFREVIDELQGEPELSRAGGERAGTPIEEKPLFKRLRSQIEQAMGEMTGESDVHSQSRVLAGIAVDQFYMVTGGRSPSADALLGRHEPLAERLHKVEEENAALRTQLAAIEAARAEAEPGVEMTDDEFTRELSPEYLEWSNSDSEDIVGPVEEIQRLCEVIVGLRRHIAAMEAARAKAMEGAAPEFDNALDLLVRAVRLLGPEQEALVKEFDRRACIIAAQAEEFERLRAELATAQKISRDVIAAAGKGASLDVAAELRRMLVDGLVSVEVVDGVERWKLAEMPEVRR